MLMTILKTKTSIRATSANMANTFYSPVTVASKHHKIKLNGAVLHACSHQKPPIHPPITDDVSTARRTAEGAFNMEGKPLLLEGSTGGADVLNSAVRRVQGDLLVTFTVTSKAHHFPYQRCCQLVWRCSVCSFLTGHPSDKQLRYACYEESCVSRRTRWPTEQTHWF